MTSFLRPRLLLAVAAMAALVVPDAAADVRHMNLEQLCGNADRVFRGTVLGVTEGRVQVGGGELPTAVYTIRVDETFKGDFEEIKGQRIVTLRMISAPKPASAGPAQRLSIFMEIPRFDRGHDYLFLLTPESAIGLSTTVGLRQGAFKVEGKPGQETAVNGIDNSGLFRGMAAAPDAAPLTYAALSRTIQNILGR